jgi:hypothetical protein
MKLSDYFEYFPKCDGEVGLIECEYDEVFHVNCLVVYYESSDCQFKRRYHIPFPLDVIYCCKGMIDEAK